MGRDPPVEDHVDCRVGTVYCLPGAAKRSIAINQSITDDFEVDHVKIYFQAARTKLNHGGGSSKVKNFFSRSLPKKVWPPLRIPYIARRI